LAAWRLPPFAGTGDLEAAGFDGEFLMMLGINHLVDGRHPAITS